MTAFSSFPRKNKRGHSEFLEVNLRPKKKRGQATFLAVSWDVHVFGLWMIDQAWLRWSFASLSPRRAVAGNRKWGQATFQGSIWTQSGQDIGDRCDLGLPLW